jgi:hypothetical protein
MPEVLLSELTVDMEGTAAAAGKKYRPASGTGTNGADGSPAVDEATWAF